MLDIAIIGSGPAGLTAAIYARRAGLDILVIEKEYMGTGQIADSSRVDNYPGFPGTDGYSLGEAFRNHAESLGTEFLDAQVTSINKKDGFWELKCDNGTDIHARAVIYSAGCKHRNLGIEGEEKYYGKGISYCAVCDGAFYKGKSVAVVGGGDTALDDALYLSDVCEKVYLIHRRDGFRGATGTLNKLKAKENVFIKTNAVIKEITGENKLDGVILSTGEKLEISGLFVAVGMIPQTELLNSFGVLDENKYIKAEEDGKTSVDGLYAAGDVRTKKLRQVITAASDGANTVNSILEYLA